MTMAWILVVFGTFSCRAIGKVVYWYVFECYATIFCIHMSCDKIDSSIKPYCAIMHEPSHDHDVDVGCLWDVRMQSYWQGHLLIRIRMLRNNFLYPYACSSGIDSCQLSETPYLCTNRHMNMSCISDVFGTFA